MPATVATRTYRLTRPVQAMPDSTDDWMELKPFVPGEPWVIEDDQREHHCILVRRCRPMSTIFAVFGDDIGAFEEQDRDAEFDAATGEGRR